MGASGRNVEEEEEETFSKGSRVEVTSNEEGFTGAWYLATVKETPSPPKKRSRSPTGNRRTYLVQYENLLCDDDPSKPLCEYVDVSFIRPEQPPTAGDDDDGGGNYGFSVNDVVDVNHRDGWWTGVVKEVLEVDGTGSKKYSVCFQNPPDEIECDGSDIRVHLDWVDRKWVRPEKQKSEDANLDTDKNLKTFKAGNALEEQPPCQLESKEQAVGKHGSGSAHHKNKRRAEKRSHAERFHASAKGDKGYKLRFNAGEVVEKGGGEVVEKEGVEDVVFAEETGSEAQNLHQLPEKASLEFVRNQDPQARELDKNIMESDESNDESHIRKKRGRTQELLAEILKGSIEGEKNDIAAGALNQLAVKNVATSAVHIPTRLRRGILWSDSIDDFPSWMLNKECHKLVADSKRFLSGGRRPDSRRKLGESKYELFNFKVTQNRSERSTMLLLEECQDKTTSVNNSSPIQDPQNASKGQSSEVHKNSDSDARDATDVINDELPSDIFDEEDLFTWYEGMKSTTLMNYEVSNGTVLELLNESGVLDESNDRQTHTPMQTQSVVVNKSVEGSQNLPFAKCSPVWKSIESLDVFQKTPQRPHFSPLVKCSEDSREGLAVGHMITFANLVERTLNLQVSDPQSLIERSLETLEELENHGFEVEAVRNRLTELQGLKAKVGELKDSSKEAEGEIMKLNVEKKQIEKLMDIVEMKMREIKEKLGEAASLKETKVKQIDVLQSKVNFFADSIENAIHDFERVVASPL